MQRHDGPLGAWFFVANQFIRSSDLWLLGGWVRVWIGNPKAIRALSWACKSFKPFLYPVCQHCGEMRIYQCHFSHAHWQPLCRERIVRANTCYRCHLAHPHLSPWPLDPNGNKDHFGMRELAIWSKECERCGLQFSDKWVHDTYVCRHPQPLAQADNESSLSSSLSDDTQSVDSEDLHRQYLGLGRHSEGGSGWIQ